MNPRLKDNDAGEISVTLDGKELRGWSYASDAERRTKMLAAREYVEGWCEAAERSRPVTAGADDHRVYFACENCEEHNPEGAVSCRADIAVMPDGTWLCDGCYSDCDKTAYGLVANDIDDFEFPRFEDLPRPAAYPADPAVTPHDCRAIDALADIAELCKFAHTYTAEHLGRKITDKIAAALAPKGAA